MSVGISPASLRKMASSTKNGKVQLLDTERPNIVPKFTSLDDERMDKTKPPVPVPNASNIRELLTMSKDGKLPLDQRKDVMERIDAARDAMKTMKKKIERRAIFFGQSVFGHGCSTRKAGAECHVAHQTHLSLRRPR